MLFALLLDVLDVGSELLELLSAHHDMTTRVIADLEAVRMELLDLVPGHVVLLVLGEIEPFGDEKGGAESMFLEERSDEGCVAGDRIVEGQHDGTGFLLLCHERFNRERERERKAKQ